jgi:two-component system, OmpR family, sensor histidine kinase TorS
MSRRKGLQLLVTNPVNHLISSDYIRVKQICNNLVSNAIKYTNVGCVSVNINLETIVDSEQDIEDQTYSSHVLQLSFDDTGTGLVGTEKKAVFESFARLNRNCTDQIGTGLGLAITRQIVAALNGTVTVQSDGLDCGCQFYVVIPVKLCTEKTVDCSFDSVSSPPIHIQNCLIIEDSKLNALLLQRMIKVVSSCSAVIAGTCAEGIEQLNGPIPYDVVFLDMNLPDGSGLQIGAMMRSTSFGGRYQMTRIVIVSADVPVDIYNAWKDMKNITYALKPFTRNSVMVAMQDIATSEAYDVHNQ